MPAAVEKIKFSCCGKELTKAETKLRIEEQIKRRRNGRISFNDFLTSSTLIYNCPMCP